jgi:soluble lytic murein transglycosylase
MSQDTGSYLDLGPMKASREPAEEPPGPWAFPILVLQSVGVIAALTSLAVIYLPDLPVVGRFFYPLNYKETIVEEAGFYGLDPLFVAAVIRQESGFRPHVHSGVGAVGLMQLMPKTASWAAGHVGLKGFKVEQLEDPEVNIKLGCWYLSYLFQQFKEPDKVLMAYNGGEGNVSSWSNQQGEQLAYAYPETQTYVGATMRAYQRYKALYEGEVPRLMRHGRVPGRVERTSAPAAKPAQSPTPGAGPSVKPSAKPSPKPRPSKKPETP